VEGRETHDAGEALVVDFERLVGQSGGDQFPSEGVRGAVARAGLKSLAVDRAFCKPGASGVGRAALWGWAAGDLDHGATASVGFKMHCCVLL
jgi:hypothetical protein